MWRGVEAAKRGVNLENRRVCREPLDGPVQVDDGYVGGRSSQPGRPNGTKALVLVATEPAGRVRIEHSPDLTKKSVKSFVDRNLTDSSEVTTDGYRSFSTKSLGTRRHHQHNQKNSNHPCLRFEIP